MATLARGQASLVCVFVFAAYEPALLGFALAVFTGIPAIKILRRLV
jgi:hypothetical protein